MTKPRTDTFVIYHSPENGCWLAHSIETDQVGDGESVLDAIVCLMRSLETLHREAKKDPTIQVWRKAPLKIRRMATAAKALPIEIMEIAHKRVHGHWPTFARVEIDTDGPYSAAKVGDACVPA
jgi:hypothetical protein